MCVVRTPSCVCIYTETKGQQQCLLLLSTLFNKVSHGTWSSPIQLGCLAKQTQGSLCLHSLSSGIVGIPLYLAFSWGWDSNSGPQARTANTISTKPSPKPFLKILKDEERRQHRQTGISDFGGTMLTAYCS